MCHSLKQSAPLINLALPSCALFRFINICATTSILFSTVPGSSRRRNAALPPGGACLPVAAAFFAIAATRTKRCEALYVSHTSHTIMHRVLGFVVSHSCAVKSIFVVILPQGSRAPLTFSSVWNLSHRIPKYCVAAIGHLTRAAASTRKNEARYSCFVLTSA